MNRSFVFDGKTEQALQAFANRMRKNMLQMMKNAGPNGAHIGGAFSAADILACLYGGILNVAPDRVHDPERDRMILSKGHISVALYSALFEAGFLSWEELMSFEADGSEFATHAHKNLEKGIELSSGSLGLGLSYGAGAALAAKRKGQDYDCFVLLGDGECNEGCVWEAAQAAAKYRLDNLTAIVDFNRQSLDGFLEDSMPVCSYRAVFEGFGWNAVEIDGHDYSQLCGALCAPRQDGKPTAIIARTVKGKGVSFMEDKVGWHHATLTQEQYEQALRELEAQYGV